MEEMKKELLALLQKAIAAGEKGAEVLVKEVPQVAEGYLSYLFWWNGFSVVVVFICMVAGGLGCWALLDLWKEENGF